MRYRYFIGCLLVLGPGLSLLAQSVSLEVGSGQAVAGSEVEIPIRLSTNAPVAGFTIACDWDSAVGQGVELRNLAVGPNDPGVLIHIAEVRDNHMIMVVVLSPLPVSNLLASGNDILLGTLVIRCDPALTGSINSAVSFRDNVYNTIPPGPFPLKNRVTVFSNNRFVELADGSGLGLTAGNFGCNGVVVVPDLRLTLGDAVGQFNNEVEIPIRLSTNAPVTGFTIACDWDSSVGVGVELRNLALNLGDPGVLVQRAEVSSDHMIMAVVLNPVPLTNLLDPGNDILLGNLVIRCGPGPLPAASAITFRDDVYNTTPPGLFPIRNRVSVFFGGQFVEFDRTTVQLTDGSLDCNTVPPQFHLALGRVVGSIGGRVEIPLTLSAADDVKAVQAVFDWNGTAGTGVEINVAPAIASRAEFIRSHIEADWMTLSLTTVASPLNGNDILLANAVIECASTVVTPPTPVVFRDAVHAVPGSPLTLSNTVTVGNQSVKQPRLQLTNGTFECLPKACPIEDLVCVRSGGQIRLSWRIAQSPECACTEILIREVATGAVVAGPLAANATSVDIPCALLQSAGSLCVICIGPDGGAASACCGYACEAFVRGDGNDDGTIDLSDAVTVLSCLFGGLLCPTCLDAADCNDDGTIDLSDAVCVLDCVFATGPCPDPPFPGCTIDQTTDNLGCGLYTSC